MLGYCGLDLKGFLAGTLAGSGACEENGTPDRRQVGKTVR